MRFQRPWLTALPRARRIFFALMAAASPCVAQHAPTLDEVLAVALRRSFDTRLAVLRTDSANAEVRIANAYANPTATIAPQSPYQYLLTLPVDVGPQRVFRTRAARAGADAAAFDARDTERNVRFAVREAFYHLLLADSLRAIALEQRANFRDILAADSARVRTGDAPERYLAKSELEFARADAALIGADAAVRSVRLALQALMGVEHPDTGFRVTGELAWRPVSAPNLAGLNDSLVHRPDVAAAQRRVSASTEARRLATALLLPVPLLSLVYQRGAPFPNGQSAALGVGVQVPVWNFFGGERARAASSEALARIAETRTRAQAEMDIATAIDQFRSAESRAQRLNTGLLEKARTAVELSRYAYAAGAISYLELLDDLRTHAETRADAASALYDYWVSVYAIARASGREIVP